MSTISSSTSEKVFRIAKFAGLNESQDGENNLEVNEASLIVNCKITKERNLKKRPGTKTWIDVDNSPIKGLWYGLVNGQRYLLCACNNKLYKLDVVNKTKTQLGSINTTNRVNFFAFSNIVYIQDGYSYKQFDGTTLSDVVGYVPIVLISCLPAGSGDEYEEINKLSASRRVWYSPNGTASTFYIPSSEKPNLVSIDYVKDLKTDTCYPEDAYSIDLTNGSITFDGSCTETFHATATKRTFVLQTPVVSAVTSVSLGETVLTPITDYSYNPNTKVLALLIETERTGTVTVTESTTTIPSADTNSLEIKYTVNGSSYSQVSAMTNAELFSGGTDAIVCIYGDNTNEFFYSSVAHDDGLPRADYFPDLNEAAVGSSNSPITQLIRHQSRMIAFKSDETYSITFSTETLDNGLIKFAFNIVPVNREKGNIAKGMVQLVDNAPRTLWNGDCYYWVNSSYYSSNLTADERQARCCSDKVHDTLSSFDLENVITYDDNREHEYWICYKDSALIECYEKGVEAWYYYEGLEITSFVRINDKLFLGMKDGRLVHIDEGYTSDYTVNSNGNLISNNFKSYYSSGAIDFGRPDMYKFINKLFISIKPQGRGEINIRVFTDKKITSSKKMVTSNIFDFSKIIFGPAYYEETFNLTSEIRSFELINPKFKSIKTVYLDGNTLNVDTDYTFDEETKIITILLPISSVGVLAVYETQIAEEYNSFTFETNNMPRTKRLKIKSKKFTYWKVIAELESEDTSFTLTNIAVPVRYTGSAK